MLDSKEVPDKLQQVVAGINYYLMVKQDHVFLAEALSTLQSALQQQETRELSSPTSQQEADALDAKRYRWLRQLFVPENLNSIEPPTWRTDFRDYLMGETFDEAIDAAMKAGEARDADSKGGKR